MVNESQFCDWVKKNLNSSGCVILKIHGDMYQVSGWPDLYVAHWRWQGFIELKVKNNKPSPIQYAVMKNLRSRGVNAGWMRLKGNIATFYLPDDEEVFSLDVRKEEKLIFLLSNPNLTT